MNTLFIPCILIILLLGGIGNREMQPDKKPKIQNMERLNSAANEDDPCPSVDGSQFLYASDAGGTRQLFLSERKGAGEPLGAGKLVDELTGEGECRSGYLVPKGKDGWEYLYFATQYHTDKKQPNLDIYRVGRFNPLRPFQGYSAASPVQAIASEADEAYPWVAADAKELYFSRKTKEGWQLMRSMAKEPHVFEKPEVIPLKVGYHHAAVSRTGLVMILQGPLKRGETRQGLFICRRATKNDAWADPKPINSLNSDEGPMGTCSPSLSGDNRYLYFASDRPGGKGGLDLYVVQVSEVSELKK